jgi:hypothetical protein
MSNLRALVRTAVRPAFRAYGRMFGLVLDAALGRYDMPPEGSWPDTTPGWDRVDRFGLCPERTDDADPR